MTKVTIKTASGSSFVHDIAPEYNCPEGLGEMLKFYDSIGVETEVSE